jgi:hypothetical protein
VAGVDEGVPVPIGNPTGKQQGKFRWVFNDQGRGLEGGSRRVARHDGEADKAPPADTLLGFG